jgi:uncharacterized protein YukJ
LKYLWSQGIRAQIVAQDVGPNLIFSSFSLSARSSDTDQLRVWTVRLDERAGGDSDQSTGRANSPPTEKTMTLPYGFVKCKLRSDPRLQSSRHGRETQYHLHAGLNVPSSQGAQNWDSAINVGTDDSDDLLKFRLIYDFHHPIRDTLSATAAGFHSLTGQKALPALDFLRSDLLAETGPWRISDVMDGSGQGEPAASLARLLQQANAASADVYIFGRTYRGGDLGIHDVHMNQGSSGAFLNDGHDDRNDHNDIWQDGAVLVDLGDDRWAGYFTAFTQQSVPTDNLGNPDPGGHPIGDADPGSKAT